MNDDSVIHIGIIVKGVGFGHEKSHQLKYQFVTTYRSILKHAKRKNLHFLIMTDPRSVPYLEKIMRKFAERDRCKCIEVSYDFINTHIITRPYIRAINKIRPYFTSNSQQVRIWRYLIWKKSVFFFFHAKMFSNKKLYFQFVQKLFFWRDCPLAMFNMMQVHTSQ